MEYKNHDAVAQQDMPALIEKFKKRMKGKKKAEEEA
jgi:hypothetical protein